MTKENKKIIRGSFGGRPSPPPPPTRTPDTLHSRQFATIQDLISEGEIEGFATASKEGRSKNTTTYNNAALKDVFLNKTPVLKSNADSTSPASTDFNHQDVTFIPRFGTSDQSFIPGIETSESPSSVGVVVTQSSPVTRQITDTNVDAIKVTLTWPQLQQITDKGDILGLTVDYKIQIQYQSGGFSDSITPENGGRVTGRSADAYQRDHRISLDRSRIDAETAFPVDIRVVRVTADPPDNNTKSEFQFTSFSEIIDNKSPYLNSAYTHLRLDSQKFSSIPQRMYRIRGIKVRIPGAGASNSGTPSIDNATGRIVYPSGYIFNGVMGAAVYTNCPAMILLDLLTNTRYGLGNHIVDSNLDLFSFVAASKYANEEVDDGTGAGTKEARFSCNVNIQKESEAFDVINDLSSVMKCMPIWTAGAITITQDKPVDASYLFNLSNIASSGFSYTGSSLKQRHSVVKVGYFNMDSREIDYEVVEDSTAISKFGVSIKSVKAFGCTSRNQAARLGRSILFAEQRESEVISFTTSIDSGAIVRPGSVIAINDPVRAGARRGGRVVAATTTKITIDSVGDTNLPDVSDNPKISVILPDGTVEERNISTYSASNEVNVSSAFSQLPNVNTIYLLTSTSLETQLFRVITVEEQDDVTYQISALSYVPGKYAFIEDGTALPTRNVSLLTELKDPPGNLVINETTVVINNIARSKVIISWQPVQGVSKYLVSYKFEDGNYISAETYSPDFEILDTQKGTYEVQVFSYNSLLQLSANSTSKIFIAEGKTAIPENVSSLTVEPINEQFVRLRFAQATAIDVLHGGRVYVRHTNLTGGSATFQAAQDVIEAAAGNVTEVIAPALAGTYLVKFQDDGGRFSEVAASAEISLVDILDSIIVKEDREDDDTPTFNNTTSSLFTNTEYSSNKGGLILTNPSAIISGTYSQTTISPGTAITCTINSHGLSQGEFLNFRFTTGDAVNGKFVITSVTNANVFVITAEKSLASELIHTGNVSVDRGLRGTYDFKDTLDLGGIFSLTLKRHFQGTGFYTGDQFDNRTDNIDTWTDFDGTVANDANAKLVVRTTVDNPSSSPTYSEFNDVANGTFKGRGFQFRTILETNDAAQNMNIQQLGYIATMPSRTEQSTVIASGSGAKAVTFASPFFVGASGITGIPKPSVSITPQHSSSKQMVTGDYFELTNISGTGFTVHFKNSSGGSIDRDFTYSAVGFGKGG